MFISRYHIGLPLCERLREQLVQHFQNNVPQSEMRKNKWISSSIEYNAIKRLGRNLWTGWTRSSGL